MYVTNYQMHNVLKVYSNQLSRCGTPVSESPAVRKPSTVAIDISAGGKRQNLIERIAADIVARIRDGGGKDDGEPTPSEHLEEKSHDTSGAPKDGHAQFIYNVIRGESGKKTHALSVEDADFLARRFEELVRKMMDRSAHSFSV